MISVAVALWAGLQCLSSGAALDWAEPVIADSAHNAFTDLVHWRGGYFLCFRKGTSHGSADGGIRIMRSLDMHAWSPCATVDTLGDDRDPHFVATPGRLYVLFGVWSLVHGGGTQPVQRDSVRSNVVWTEDGEKWTSAAGIYEPRWWVWRALWHEDAFWGFAYTAYRPKPSERELRLVRSADALHWETVGTVGVEAMPSESDGWFGADGSLNVISRMGDASGGAYLYRSDASRVAWSSVCLGSAIHSPAVALWKGRVFVAGRGKGEGGYNTSLWEVVDGKAVLSLTLPSGGDTSYPGLLVDPATASGDAPGLFVSWYSQHEAAGEDGANVYVGRVTVGP